MEETQTYLSANQLKKAAEVLKTIAHPLRISIVDLLTENSKLSVTEICDILKSEQSLTSHHLNTLRKHGVVKTERKGQSVFYSLQLTQISKVIECMQECNFDDI